MHGVEQDLGRGPGRTQQDLVELGRIQQIAVRLPQIAVRLPSHSQSLVVESVETGRRV